VSALKSQASKEIKYPSGNKTRTVYNGGMVFHSNYRCKSFNKPIKDSRKYVVLQVHIGSKFQHSIHYIAENLTSKYLLNNYFCNERYFLKVDAAVLKQTVANSVRLSLYIYLFVYSLFNDAFLVTQTIWHRKRG
jgi:transposase-like protein